MPSARPCHRTHAILVVRSLAAPSTGTPIWSSAGLPPPLHMSPIAPCRRTPSRQILSAGLCRRLCQPAERSEPEGHEEKVLFHQLICCEAAQRRTRFHHS
jgi:hypothetical protein